MLGVNHYRGEKDNNKGEGTVARRRTSGAKARKSNGLWKTLWISR
jgi:hypothetical protein